MLGGLTLFGIVFALNSSVHSYLVLAYSEADRVSLSVGFYYMANACGVCSAHCCPACCISRPASPPRCGARPRSRRCGHRAVSSPGDSTVSWAGAKGED